MKLKFLTAIALCAMALFSCDEDTGTLGDSLTGETNKLVVSTQQFNVLTHSTAVDSVYTRERQCYFGRVYDPETGTYVKSEFSTQFNMMEHAFDDIHPKEDIFDVDMNGEVLSDTCIIYIYVDIPSSYGDSLTSMKLRITELDRPISGSNSHYTNFDAKSAGYLREGGVKVDKMFSMRDLTTSDSIRSLYEANLHRNANTSDNGFYDVVTIPLADPYTAKDGKTYRDYGTYILRTYYDHPEYFKNSYSFIKNVCPGFYVETIDGVGLMARVKEISMYIFYRIDPDKDLNPALTYLMTTSTEEVLQTSTIINDKEKISQLINDNSCTYVKSPAGIFTEVELPVDDICTAHPNDSLLSAKIAFKRINNSTEDASFAFSKPSKLLLIEKDSLNSFFLGNNTYNNTYAYQASLASNAYSYSNISNLLTRMHNNKVNGLKSDPNWVSKHPDWNKALLVPIDEVTVTTSSYSGTSSTVIALKNKMGLSSTRLEKGSETNPIKLEVIYAKFKE